MEYATNFYNIQCQRYIIKHWFPSNETKSWLGESYCTDTLRKAFVEQYIVTQFYSQASRPLLKKSYTTFS